MRAIGSFIGRILSILGTMFTLGLSLLPLSALLLAYPAIYPQESVLSDSVTANQSGFRIFLRRLFSLFAALIVLLTILAVSVEVVSRLPLPPKGQFGSVARGFLDIGPTSFMPPDKKGKILSEATPAEKAQLLKPYFPLSTTLPPAMVEHWPIVLLGMYLLDILVLIFLGKVPLAYNIRNVVVRWKVTSLTLFAFMFVVGLLVFMLGFVNGMNNLTENTGIPGNVFVLSEGATDELFSNLGYGDLDNVERATTNLSPKDEPLRGPDGKIRSTGVKKSSRDGREFYLASRETYYVINQQIPNSNPPRRRFVQVRSLEDAQTAQAVHNIELNPGGRWFSQAGVDNDSRIECVIGEGVAGTLGADQGKGQLGVGDSFDLGDMRWVITGVMKSEGTTFGSEIWVKRFSRIYQPFGKEKYTTLVMRVDDDSAESARALAFHLAKRYTQQKLKAFSEPDYYAELTKTNNQFLSAIIMLAVIMAIGGVFGMMTTMFASIAQRIRDIGVLRLLGFKRWQVLVSFMLESLVIALVGGGLGVLAGYILGDGKAATSTLSSGGGGGGKNFAVRIDIDAQIMAVGMLLTLIMGRLGGLVPALSAMRIKVLDSLR